MHWGGGYAAPGYIKLVPTNRRRPGPALIVVDGMRYPQGFRAGEIFVDQRSHQLVAESIEQDSGYGLRHEVSGGCKRVHKASDRGRAVRGSVSAKAEGGVSGCNKVNVK